MPVSSLIAGSRMLTADVFALTTSVDRQVTASTPRAPATTEVSLIEVLPPRLAASSALGKVLNEQRLGDHHLLDLRGVHALVGRMDPSLRHVFGAPKDELGPRGDALERPQQ